MNIIHLFLIVLMVAMWNYRESVADMTMRALLPPKYPNKLDPHAVIIFVHSSVVRVTLC